MRYRNISLKQCAPLVILFILCVLPSMAHAAGFSGILSVTCFVDANENGTHDAGETGIEGVTVTLRKITLTRFFGFSENAVSDATGHIAWNGLACGLYLAEVQASDDYRCTTAARKLILVSALKKTHALQFGFAPGEDDEPTDPDNGTDPGTDPPVPPPPVFEKPSLTVEASQSNITRGQSTTLTWMAANAMSVIIAPGIGPVATSGSLSVKPSKTITFLFSAFGPGGAVIKTVTIRVVSPTPPDNGTPDNGDDDIPDDNDDDDQNGDDEPTRVSLTAFTAARQPEHNRIMWETASEAACAGFNLYRADSETGPFHRLNTAVIAPCGSPSEGCSYVYIDTTAGPMDACLYLLEEIDLQGMTVQHGPVALQP